MSTTSVATDFRSQRQLTADLNLATSQDISIPRLPHRKSLRPRASSTTTAFDVTHARAVISDRVESSQLFPTSSTLRLAGHLDADSEARTGVPELLDQGRKQELGLEINEDVRDSPPPIHPFANSNAKLELIPAGNGDSINVAEETALYDELCRTYEDETEEFDGANTPTVASSSAMLQSLTLTSAPTRNSAPGPLQTHRRRRSSLPPESIFSADIFLADNTHSPTSPNNSASWDTPPLFASNVSISGWSTVGSAGKSGKGGAGAYVVYDITISTREGTTIHALKRYSAFEELASRLRRGLPPFRIECSRVTHQRPLLPFLPSLPPKAPLARFRPAFLETRRRLLQFWLVRVLLHPELGGRREVREWVLS